MDGLVVLIFFAVWISAVFSFGFILGFGLGWIPAMFIANILGAVLGEMFR